jgi:hypothetical protein
VSYTELVAQTSPDVDICIEEEETAWSGLVESGGELMLVRLGSNLDLKVFNVNVEQKLLEEVKSLGGCRALFLGDRCVSVDADKLPSVDGDCVYISHFWPDHGTSTICVHNLRDDTMKVISSKNMYRISYYLDRPFSLVQVLLQ